MLENFFSASGLAEAVPESAAEAEVSVPAEAAGGAAGSAAEAIEPEPSTAAPAIIAAVMVFMVTFFRVILIRSFRLTV